MKIVLASATRHEIEPISTQLKNFIKHDIEVCYTGVGMLQTGVALMQAIYARKPQLIVQAGIAGSFNTGLILGEVYTVKNEYYGDLGVLENGEWNDVFDLDLADSNANNFTNKALYNYWVDEYNLLNLPKVNAVTVNAITTNKNGVQELIKKYNPQLESMEGIALHHVGLTTKTAFLQLRAVSNYVGERDKTKWKMKEAITNLNNTLITLLNKL